MRRSKAPPLSWPRTVWFGVVLGSAAVFIPALAFASRVPESAASQATQIAPELLENSAQIFRFPQRGMLHDPQLFLLRTASPQGGILINGASVGFLLLTQSPTFSDEMGNTEAREFQVGGSARFGRVRSGLAFRGAYRKRESGTIDYYLSQEPRSRGERTLDSHREAAFGLGLTGDRGFVDASIEFRWDDESTANFEQSSFDTSGVSVDADADQGFGSSIVAGIEFGPHVRWTAYGSIRGAKYRINQRAILQGEFFSEFETERFQEWSIGTSIAHRTRSVGEVTWSATARNIRGLKQLEWDTRRSSRGERYDFSGSIRRRIGDGLELTAGLRIEYDRRSDHSTRRSIFSSAAMSETIDNVDSFASTFGWGLSKRIRRIELTGSMWADLSLSDPFLALDAAFQL